MNVAVEADEAGVVAEVVAGLVGVIVGVDVVGAVVEMGILAARRILHAISSPTKYSVMNAGNGSNRLNRLQT